MVQHSKRRGYRRRSFSRWCRLPLSLAARLDTITHLSAPLPWREVATKPCGHLRPSTQPHRLASTADTDPAARTPARQHPATQVGVRHRHRPWNPILPFPLLSTAPEAQRGLTDTILASPARIHLARVARRRGAGRGGPALRSRREAAESSPTAREPSPSFQWKKRTCGRKDVRGGGRKAGVLWGADENRLWGVGG
jgi:hypothetical protein